MTDCKVVLVMTVGVPTEGTRLPSCILVCQDLVCPEVPPAQLSHTLTLLAAAGRLSSIDPWGQEFEFNSLLWSE